MVPIGKMIIMIATLWLVSLFGISLFSIERIPFPPSPPKIDSSLRSNKLLVFGMRVPLWDSRGSDSRLYEFLKGVSMLGFQVDLVVPHNAEVRAYHIQAVSNLGVTLLDEKEALQQLESNRFPLHSYGAAIFQLFYWNWPRATSFKLFYRFVKRLPLIVMSDDFHAYREQHIAALTCSRHQKARADSILRDELRVYQLADRLLAITPNDVKRFIKANVDPSKVDIFRYTIADILPPATLSNQTGIIFVGGPNSVNTESISWFLTAVLPLLPIPWPTVYIIGYVQIPTALLRKYPNVKRLGRVADVDSYLQNVRISISPIIAGTGINTKSILALSRGVPLVSTSKGAEGIDSCAMYSVWIADTPSDFATAVTSLLTDNELWLKYSKTGHECALSHFSRSTLRKESYRLGQWINNASHDFERAATSNTYNQAYGTFLCGDDVGHDGYLRGALTLGSSLRTAGIERDLVLFGVRLSRNATQLLELVYDRVINFENYIPNANFNRSLSDKLPFLRSDLDSWQTKYPEQYQFCMFNKLHMWSLVEYDRFLYIDADYLSFSNFSEVFEQYQPLAAVPEAFPSDNFNSGFMLIAPSFQMYHSLVNQSQFLPSFNGGDQGFLNAVFADWRQLHGKYHVLPSIYNTMTKLKTTFLPAWHLLRPQLKGLHYSPTKPWRDLPWKDVEKEQPLSAWEKTKMAVYHEEHMFWWREYGRVPLDDRWNIYEVVLSLSYPTLSPYCVKCLHIGLHAQTLNRTDGFVSGSEITTAHLQKAFQRSGVAVTVTRYSIDSQRKLEQDKLDLLFIEGYDPSLPQLITSLRKRNPQLKIFFWCLSIASSYTHRLAVDAFFTNSRILSKHLHRFAPTFYLPLAGSPAECAMTEPSARRLNVTYLATWTLEKQNSSYNAILNASQAFGLKIFGSNWQSSDYVSHYGGRWESEPNDLFRFSRVTLGITVESQRSLGMINNRVFDAAACGTPMITDFSDELYREFGDLLFYSQSPADTIQHLSTILNWTAQAYIEHSEKLRAFVQSSHTYDHRVQSILAVYNALMVHRSSCNTAA